MKNFEWVIKGTDEPFDFSSRVTGNLELEAKFEEYKYKIVSIFFLITKRPKFIRHFSTKSRYGLSLRDAT